MIRHVVVGTAGHIDHGKTTLVRALTGVDTDRLAEEKARGITIDLGFAPLTLDDVTFSIVDVPGHEGFIRNMVAGATGVDLALLVVAADEGVMPQTREHIAILRFLGVRRGVVALTKSDLAPDADWRALVADDVAALLGETVGREWPVVEVSAETGAGLDGLRAELLAAAAQVGARGSDDLFRLPVDRVFALAGAGTIVTGTVWSGAVAEGDNVTVLPAGQSARVRSVQVHGKPAPAAEPGRRAALALVGVERTDAARGAVVVTGRGWHASRAMDVLLTLAPGHAVRMRQRVRVHHGTAEVMARIGRLEAREPDVAARLMLEAPLVPRAGDRLVLRSYSPTTTIAGGLVLDPWADRLPPRSGARRSVCPSWSDDTERVLALVRRRGPDGMTGDDLRVAAGLGVSALTASLKAACQIGLARDADWYVAAGEVAPVAGTLESALRAYHSASPLEPGMPLSAWRGAAERVPAALVGLAEQSLLGSGAVERDGSVARLTEFKAGTGDAASSQREQLLADLKQAGAEPPSVQELAARHPDLDVHGTLRFLARSGQVVAVGKDRFYEAGALEMERQKLVAALAETGQGASASVLREKLGRSRKYLIPFLEWADREGVTVRQGDLRVVGPKGVLDGQTGKA